MKSPALSLTLFLVLPASLAQQPQPPPPQPKLDRAAAAKPKRKLDADLSGFDVSDKSGKKVPTMLGGSRNTAIPSAILLAPKRGKLYGASAVFPWTFAGHNEGYVIIITDEEETQLVRQQVKEPRFVLASATGKFEPGQVYYWRVQVLPNPLASDPLEFVVVSPEERQVIDAELASIPPGDLYETALARARILANHRLWFDALGAYADLMAKFPDRAEPYRDRSAIYAQVAATKSLSESDGATAAKLPK
jgi:hypothetical protein